MKAKTVVVKGNKDKLAKTISEALLMAVDEARFEIENGTYLEESGGRNHVAGCAIGAVFAKAVPWRTVIEAAAEEMGRKEMIEAICKHIPGACDVVPLKIWNEEVGDHAWHSSKKEHEGEERNRWIDMVEHLFEDNRNDFEEIAKVFKKYNK